MELNKVDMLTNKLAADIPSQDSVIDVTNNTSETRKSKYTKAKLIAPPLERSHAKLNHTKRTASSTHPPPELYFYQK